MIGLAVGAAYKADYAHSCCSGSADSRYTVFDDETMLWFCIHSVSGIPKKMGSGFAGLNLIRAEYIRRKMVPQSNFL
jgi:hypothetical protein